MALTVREAETTRYPPLISRPLPRTVIPCVNEFFFSLILPLPIATPNLRRNLRIGDLPFTTWRCSSLAQTTAPAHGIHTPYLYVAVGSASANNASNSPAAAAAVVPSTVST